MSDLTGQTIKGYEFHQQIGSGGFGAVYHAYQPVLKREVAIKVIRPDYANDPDFIRRFEVEAELVAQLEHPHIVPLFDFWREPDSAFLVMRLLRGGSLRSRVRDGALPPELIAVILEQIAGALHTAHGRGVVHLDIKPDNMLLDLADNAYLTDFGIAKKIGVSDGNNDEIQGSLHYIAPEQIQGGELGAFTDIYGLGIALYELVTGEHPFGSQTSVSELVFKHLQDDPPSVQIHRADLPAEIDDVIHKATAKDYQQRFASVPEMAQAFRRAITPAAVMNDTTFPFLIDDADTDPADLINPYKGLRAFQEYDRGEFYGRETLVTDMVNQLRDHRFLAVVGPSGSGKSSVVRAGVIPALRQGVFAGSANWFIVEMFPGAHPFAELEAALLRIAVNPPASLMEQLQQQEGMLRAVKRVLPGDDSTELVLFIDQFEELFTLTNDEAQRVHFLNSLMLAVDDPHSRLRIIVTLRADFYDRPLQYRAFGERLDSQKLTVYPLSPEELEQVIERPAERAGAFLESGLTQKIIADVGEQPGTLPLLQYALTELFDRRDRRLLTMQAYHEIGGVTGALARRADEIFVALDEQGQRLARQLFMRLVTPGEGTDDTRRRTRMSEVLSIHDGMSAVIDAFDASRLLTFDNDPVTREPTIEVAHEALIRTWGRLHSWLADGRDGLRLQRRLSVAAQEWQEAHQDDAYLARDARLNQFEALLTSADIQLNELEKNYVQASVQSREERYQREQQRKAYEAALERQSINRLRYLAVALSVFLVVAGLLSVYALSQSAVAQTERDNAQTQAFIAERNESAAVAAEAEALHQAAIAAEAATQEAIARAEAETEQERADLQAQIAISQRVASQAMREIESRPEVGLLLSIEAFQRNNNFDTRNALLTAINNGAGNTTFLRDVRGEATAIAISPDGHWLAVADDASEIFLWDLQTGQRAGNHWITPSASVQALVFTPDSQRLITVDRFGDLVEWDVPTGNVVRLLVLAFPDDTRAVYFSSDSSLLAMTSFLPSRVLVFDTATGDTVGDSLATSAAFPYALTFSPDNRLLAVEDLTSQRGTVEIWTIESGELAHTLSAPDDLYNTSDDFPSVFSPDGNHLAVSYLGGVRIWDIAAESAITISDDVLSYASTPLHFNTDGSRLYLQRSDFAVIGVDTATGEILPETLTGLDGQAAFLLVTPDNRRVISVDGQGQIILWTIDGSQVLRDKLTQQVPFNTAISPDQTRIAYVDDALLLHLMNPGDSASLVEIATPHKEGVSVTAFSPDGRWLATADTAGMIVVWDLQTNTIVHTLTDHPGNVRHLQFSPDSMRLFSTSIDPAKNYIHDVHTGDLLATVAIPGLSDPEADAFGVFAADFSPDGRLLAVATLDGRLQLYDATTYEPLRAATLIAASNAIAFSPDSTLLAVPGDNNTIVLLDVATLTPARRSLVGHELMVQGMAFSPDGLLLATSDTDIRLWDMTTGQQLGSPLIMSASSPRNIREMAFTGDGQHLMAVSTTGVVRWKLDFAAIGSTICQQVGLNLTLSEWERFFPDEPYRPTCPNSAYHLTELAQHAITLEDGTAAEGLFSVAATWSHHVTDENALINLCQYGAFYGFAEVVMPACDRLADASADRWNYPLTRSYARAMSGDLAGAAADLEASLVRLRQLSDWGAELEFPPLDDAIQERENWLAALQAGENPYADEATLATLRERLEAIAAPPQIDTAPEEATIFGPVTSYEVFDQLPFDALLPANIPGAALSLSRIEDVSVAENRVERFGAWSTIAAQGDVALVYLFGFAEQNASLLLTISAADSGLDALAWVNSGGFNAQIVTLENGAQAAIAGEFAAVIQDGLLITFISPAQDKTEPIDDLRGVMEVTLAGSIRYSDYQLIMAMQAIDKQVLAGDTAAAEAALTDLLPGALDSTSPQVLNQVCWLGSLAGFADRVLPACERAVELATVQQRPFVQDSRGLARALTGDTAGAIDDFTAFVAVIRGDLSYAPMLAPREAWLQALQAGENPFDDAMLARLREEEN